MAKASSRTVCPWTAWVCGSCDSARSALARRFGSSPGQIWVRPSNVVLQTTTDDANQSPHNKRIWGAQLLTKDFLQVLAAEISPSPIKDTCFAPDRRSVLQSASRPCYWGR